jgi:CRISPR-associated endonuclease Csn1
MAVPYRLGIDMGTNSLGWCALSLDGNHHPTGIIDLGVRIFSDGRQAKTGTSLGEVRRLARQARRRRDRYIARRYRLMRLLVECGLMPEDLSERKALEKLDPYALRAKALDERLSKHELGRAIFHLNQRRGFKSNRRTERKNAEAGEIKTGITEMQRRIDQSKARTLGEFLHRRAERGKWTRNRHKDLYVDRAMIEQEFDAICAAQEHLGNPLPCDGWSKIRETLLFQRPLRPVRPGKCTLDPDDERAPWALPITQDFRMLQEIANLRVRELGVERPLSQEERSKLFEALRRKRELSFEQVRRHLKLSSDSHLNLESERREKLKGAETGWVLSRKPLFGPAWWSLDSDHQNHIVEYLIGEEDEFKLADLAEREWGLPHDAAIEIAAAPLVDGYVSRDAVLTS